VVPRDRALVIYCAGGNRSALAADTLQQMGYTNVASMAGGWGAWVAAGGAVEG
ncbi:MAG: sulfurtransferase, partial [Gemmatimonadetes bacterium]|nr:sulfurtransferase [Gemmatimonadota bacterium]